MLRKPRRPSTLPADLSGKSWQFGRSRSASGLPTSGRFVRRRSLTCSGRRARLRRLGSTDRRRRLDRPGSLLPGASLPVLLGAIYSIAGRDLFLTRICQAIIGASTCALLALAGRRLHSERVGLLAGVGLAIYAPAIFFDGLLQKSVLDLFFVSLVLWLLSGLANHPVMRSRWFSLGLALGALTLTRENGLVLIVPILVWRLLQPDVSWQSSTVRSTMLAFALGLLLVLLPVAVRNRAVGGEWHMTTSQFGPNLYLGNNANADGTAGFLRQGRGAVGTSARMRPIWRRPPRDEPSRREKFPATGCDRRWPTYEPIPGNGQSSKPERRCCSRMPRN